jgi:two-component system, chemotaxis family, chemotaxis protein CheY
MSPVPSPKGTGVVLLVEDDADMRNDLATILEYEGYRVRTASDGTEALDQLRNGLEPSLIVLDLMMPQMNGWQFREEQRKSPELLRIPLVLLSGNSDVRRHAEDLGAVDYLAKPIDLGKLIGILKQHC